MPLCCVPVTVRVPFLAGGMCRRGPEALGFLPTIAPGRFALGGRTRPARPYDWRALRIGFGGDGTSVAFLCSPRVPFVLCWLGGRVMPFLSMTAAGRMHVGGLAGALEVPIGARRTVIYAGVA